jgi:hypothetical protein
VSGEVPTVWIAAPSDPLYTVTVGSGPVQFRVPSGAMAGSGADYPMILLDPNETTFGRFVELRLWQATIDHAGRRLRANGAGLFHYNNDGAILNPDGSRSVSVPFRGFGTGSRLSYLAGVIRAQDVRLGEISHAIRFAYGACDSTNTFRAPATRTDQPNGCSGSSLGPAASRMEMGMRLQLDPSVDCAARTVPGRAAGDPETRFLRMFCRALQRYGMIMLDGTADGVFIYMEDNRSANWEPLIGATRYGNYGYLV